MTVKLNWRACEKLSPGERRASPSTRRSAHRLFFILISSINWAQSGWQSCSLQPRPSTFECRSKQLYRFFSCKELACFCLDFHVKIFFLRELGSHAIGKAACCNYVHPCLSTAWCRCLTSSLLNNFFLSHQSPGATTLVTRCCWTWIPIIQHRHNDLAVSLSCLPTLMG